MYSNMPMGHTILSVVLAVACYGVAARGRVEISSNSAPKAELRRIFLEIALILC